MLGYNHEIPDCTFYTILLMYIAFSLLSAFFLGMLLVETKSTIPHLGCSKRLGHCSTAKIYLCENIQTICSQTSARSPEV